MSRRLGLKDEHAKQFVVIERHVLEFLDREYGDSNRLTRFIRKCRYRFEVNWESFCITSTLVEFKPFPAALRPSSDSPVRSDVLQRELCLFMTEFENSSPNKQQFTLKTDRQTKSSCEIKLESGFKLGAEVDMKIAFPGSINGEMHVTKSTGQTFEETWTWGVDNQITVSGQSKVMVKLVVVEQEQVAQFTAENVIRAPFGITVFKKNRITGRVNSVICIPQNLLPEILTEADKFEKIDDSTVRYLTKGVFSGVYNAEQKLKVSKEIPETEGQAAVPDSEEPETVE